jgi:hypothetical protein
MPVYHLGNYRISVSPFYIQITKRMNDEVIVYRLPIMEGEQVANMDVDENQIMFRTPTHYLHAVLTPGANGIPDHVQIDVYRIDGEAEIPTLFALDASAPVRVFRALRAIGRNEPVEADPEPVAHDDENEINAGPQNGDPENVAGDPIAPAAGGSRRRRKTRRVRRVRRVRSKARKSRKN